MKTIVTLVVATILFALTPSCIIANEYSVADNYDTTKFVTRTFNLSDFNGISCDGVAHITYKQADNYSIVAKSSEEILNKTTITVEKNTLKIDQNNIKLKKQTPIFIEITTPQLNNIDIEGVTTFKSEIINTTDNFDIEVEGVGHIDIKRIVCASANVDVSGTCKLYGAINATDNVKLDIDGVATSEVDIEARSLDLDGGGVSNIKANFKGETAKVECDGVCKIVLTTDCKQLKATNGGVSKLTLKGIAEQTNISSSGVATVDTKELNKF